MPKKIKKEKLTGAEKANRIIAVIAMLAAVAFSAMLILLLDRVMNDESTAAAVAVCGGYTLFTLLAIVHCLQGLTVFKAQEHYGVLFGSILSGASAFAALVNLPFALVMFFSALGNDSVVQKILGERTMDDFVQSQQSAWTLLICAVAAMIFLGIAAIRRFTEVMD